EKRFKHRTGLFIAMAKHLVRSLSGLIGSASHKTLPGSSSAADSKLMVSYAMGIAQDRRNDIGFFHAVKENNKNLDASRLLFYFRFKNLYPSDTELEWFKQNHVSCFTSPPVAGEISSLPLWKPSAGFKAHLKEFYRIFIKTAVPCIFTPRMPRVWVLNNLWEMGWNVAYWKDFFITNNVRVLVHSVPGVWNFIPNLALSETGGLAVNLERSILFDYCTYFHNSPNHVNFVTGSYSLTQIPEPSFSFHTIQAGGINVGNHPPIPWIDERRKENKIVISVFDELPNDWYFGESVRQFYESLIQLVESDGSDRFVLVIKTKKPEVLERLETVNRQVRELTASGKCLFPDWKVTPASAAAHSDLVVCVPSTAAFESVLTGTPTLVFSPMKSGSSIFYTENGLDRRVFEDGASMIDAIRRFAEGDSSVGNCTDLMTRIDPFGDGNGAQRVGEYLLECLRGFDSRLTRDQILEKANRRFRQQWGDDKLTHETAYESWD
ncbi:MAG: hypothetical protein GY940_23535, partial [bacterium]|nr:hypothetical protein [bacterium]